MGLKNSFRLILKMRWAMFVLNFIDKAMVSDNVARSTVFSKPASVTLRIPRGEYRAHDRDHLSVENLLNEVVNRVFLLPCVFHADNDAQFPARLNTSRWRKQNIRSRQAWPRALMVPP